MSPRRIECTTRAPSKGARLSAPQAGKEVASVTFFNHKGQEVERKVPNLMRLPDLYFLPISVPDTVMYLMEILWSSYTCDA